MKNDFKTDAVLKVRGHCFWTKSVDEECRK